MVWRAESLFRRGASPTLLLPTRNCATPNKWMGGVQEEFEEMVSNMITAKGMKSLPEKIIQVKDMRIFIAYRRDDSTGVVHFGERIPHRSLSVCAARREALQAGTPAVVYNSQRPHFQHRIHCL